MTQNAGLTPTVITNKNNVITTVYRKPDAAAGKSATGKKAIPAPSVSKVTYAGTMRELKALGIDLTEDPLVPFSVKLLCKYDPEMQQRVMKAIREADAPIRKAWKDRLGHLERTDQTKKGDDRAAAASLRSRPSYERMLASAELSHHLKEASGWSGTANDNVYLLIEKATGIQPGDDNFAEVQAGVIYVGITNPGIVTRSYTDTSFLQTNRDDIMFIRENMEKIVPLLPELCKRRDASRATIEAMLSVHPTLVDGAL